MWPTLIGAGAKLLGGILGKPKQVSARTNSRNALMGQAQGAREAAEKYGFNPLTLLGVSSAVGPSEQANYLGQSIADAGMMLADGLAKRGEAATAQSALEQENAALREQVQSLTLRPRVGGIYAQREAVPTTRAALGGASNALGRSGGRSGVDGGVGGAGDGVSPDALRPLTDISPLDPRREVDNAPIGTSAGFMAADNPYLPAPLYVPTWDGDEPFEWDDYVTFPFVMAANGGFRAGRAIGEWADIARENARGNPVYRMEDGRLYAPVPRRDEIADRPPVSTRYPRLPDFYPEMGWPRRGQRGLPF